MFKSIASLKKNGFVGFVSVKELQEDCTCIPKEMGIYLVVLPNQQIPRFIKNGPAGFRGGRDPNVTLKVLCENWVNGTVVLYVGKAGGPIQKTKLKGRLKSYLDHGSGNKSAAHWGGRLIWQLKNSQDLLICWKVSKNTTPREDEKEFIQFFCASYGNQRPFANLRG